MRGVLLLSFAAACSAMDPQELAVAPSPPDEADAGGSEATGASLCTETPDRIECAHERTSIPAELGFSRTVYFQAPLGAQPATGWPVVLLFQGSFTSAEAFFSADRDQPFGRYYEALTVKRLLDAGYAVLAPETHAGRTFWDTNVLPWSIAWDGAPDDVFMRSILSAIEAGTFGPLDPAHQYATGISSGGYMTSRMAASYPGEFVALAIHSASWATCGGALCAVPDPLPADHPPTLFLHGGSDRVVPLRTMLPYADRLTGGGREARVVIDEPSGHQWIEQGPDEIVAWFDAHR